MVNLSEGKVTLSPLAILVMGLLAPVIGSVVHDRLSTGESSASMQVQVKALNDQFQSHMQDSVHRNEFEDLKKADAGRVTQQEFQMFANQMQADMREIKDMLAERRSK